jgi:hypothetical protein
MLSTILGLAGKRSIPLARETIPVLPFRFYTLTTHFSAQLPEIHQEPFFLHLVVYLSLLIKWGSFPLAFALVYVVNGFCLTVSFMGTGGGDEGIFFIMVFLGLVGALVLHIAIGERMRSLAAA